MYQTYLNFAQLLYEKSYVYIYVWQCGTMAYTCYTAVF